MRTLNLHDSNTFYAPASDECWVELAKCIVEMTAETYAWQFPKFSTSQKDFEQQDARSYAPIRRSILKKLCDGPVGALVDPVAYFDAFEKKLQENIKMYRQSNLK